MARQYREVLRPFEADGVMLQSGSVVDVTDWKHTEKLVSNRYLSPAVSERKPEPSEKKPATKPVAKKTTN